jgi:hypothetical protein
LRGLKVVAIERRSDFIRRHRYARFSDILPSLDEVLRLALPSS